MLTSSGDVPNATHHALYIALEEEGVVKRQTLGNKLGELSLILCDGITLQKEYKCHDKRLPY